MWISYAILVLLAAMSEPLNGVGNRHWKLFSDDNYFDTHGVFTSLVWATPLLGNALLAVVSEEKLSMWYRRAKE